jgi:predicted HicB family RNase H-like nuclease
VPRYEFVGAHLTPPVKAALRIEAQRARVSMSQLVYEAIVTQLRARGHAV